MFQNVFQRFIFMFIVTELIYLSYARSMDNLCVLLYDCIFNWNTRTSREWQLIRDITAEKSKSCTFNAIFRYTLTFLPACVSSVHCSLEHPFRHLLFCSRVLNFPGTLELLSNHLVFCSRFALLSLVCVCVVYFKGVPSFPRISCWALLYYTAP